MRKWLNAVRERRDRCRNAVSRWRYDRERPPVQALDGLRRVVFVRWDAKWGDSVVFSFVCRAFRESHPGIAVEVIATPEMAPLFRDHFGADEVHETVRKPSKAQMRELAERIGDVDLVVHFSHLIKHRDMYLLSRLRARHIAGLDDGVGLVDLKLGAQTRGLHFADKYVALLERCGAGRVDTRYVVPTEPDAERRVREWLAVRQRPFVAFNAYSKGRARSLTVDTSERVVRHLLEALPEHDVCVLSAPGKQEEVAALCAACDAGRVFHLPRTQSIYDNIALIARAEALVSGITATVHMADGLGVPSFVLFPYDPPDRDDWHSRDPRSVNFLAEPADPLDVNRLDWRTLVPELETFCRRLRQERCTEAGSDA